MPHMLVKLFASVRRQSTLHTYYTYYNYMPSFSNGYLYYIHIVLLDIVIVYVYAFILYRDMQRTAYI